MGGRRAAQKTAADQDAGGLTGLGMIVRGGRVTHARRGRICQESPLRVIHTCRAELEGVFSIAYGHGAGLFAVLKAHEKPC